MTNQGEVVPHSDFMALLEATRHYADVFEALLLKVFNEELQNVLMVCRNIEQIFIFRMVVFHRFELITCAFLRHRVKAHEANVVDVFAARQLFSLGLEVVSGAFGWDLELEAVWKEGLSLQGLQTTIHN
jgi:hypothetical protein